MSADVASRTVVVVGGGAAGIAHAVRQAELGDRAYLVEDGPALDASDIGGGASPLLGRLGRLNDRITVLTLSELEGLERADGRFKLRLRKRAARVIAELCNGCDACAKVCPATLGEVEGNLLLPRTAIDTRTPATGGYNILKETPPCQAACPVHLDVRGYIGLAADGRYRESLDLIRERLPFPGVIGRICTHPCETACNRGLADEPVAICALKRFVADHERGQAGAAAKPRPIRAATGKKIAIIGSGPAGLTCAYELANLGHEVTVFEALPVVGGMLRVGIPEYRLPRDVLDEEISAVAKAGVKIKTNIALGKDVTIDGLLQEGFNSVFVSIGAHRGQGLGVPGEEGAGVISGIDFLRELNLGRRPEVDKNVVVIGGGNVAIDSARSARRIGAARASIVYRRTRAEMPASGPEIEAALAEGIDITYLAAPREVLLSGGIVVGLRCVRMELGAADRSGRRAPVPLAGSEFVIEAGTVITAIGQSVDTAGLREAGIEIERGGIAVDELTLATGRGGVFAGGDAASGPRSAIEAVAAGRRAAESMERYLQGEEASSSISNGGQRVTADHQSKPYVDVPATRTAIARVVPSERACSFAEVELGLSQDAARAEAQRCLSCRGCLGCGLCEVVCKRKAIDFSQCDEEIEIEAGGIVITPGTAWTAPPVDERFGYGKYPDVLTGAEFQRMISEGGPFGGMVLRPSNGDVPRRIAFIVCDSPDTLPAGMARARELSSGYAAGLASAVLRKVSDADVAILGFAGRKPAGLDSARLLPGDVVRVDGSQDEGPIVELSGGGAGREHFDMVVLCAGSRFSPATARWLQELGLEKSLFWPDGKGETPSSVPGVVFAGLSLSSDSLSSST